ncbi:phosphatidylinositol/phosphatidylcholine transfer protein SFH11-like isoform X3 [Durio zibethinus]|uniref:Phosphatidylinositol/phosphatidylcholine transfer protein SFH11-like isoform X3 n=1 Tax=Durio zibethinus TaxID=66656 RepID=A0A6P5WL83_DURZI|nr:phosphatidylinositol/phosphatidylcholine transfer protein SFH11-like isoform X3 [Durio zibethinus]
MSNDHQEDIKQFLSLMENVDERMKGTFQNMHHGYPTETLVRFLKARDWNVQKAHKMLIDCLQWRIQNEIDNILAKPIIPTDLYRAVRDSQLVGLSGYSKEGLPVIAIGVGLSTYDKASVNYYVQSHIQMNEYRDRVVSPMATEKYGRHISTCLKVLDMTGLKLSALNQLKIMDYSSLPHFCRKEGSGSLHHSSNGTIDNCFSLDHTYHQQLYNYIKQQAKHMETSLPIKQGSVHVEFPEPDPEDTEIAETIESEFHRLAEQNGICNSLNGLKVNGD